MADDRHCTCHGRRKPDGSCFCGAFVQGRAQDGYVIHLPLLLRDGAPAGGNSERKALAMMTDREVQTMRDSVRGMPLADAAKLPIYDEFRGLWNHDMPAEELAALYDGAIPGLKDPTVAECRAEAYRDHMIYEMTRR